MNRAHYLRQMAREYRAEFLKAWREPAFAIPTLVFPIAFYTLFGVVLGGSNPQRAAYMLATFGVFSAMGPAMFGFGVGVSTEREKGWLDLKRVSPAPAELFLFSRLAMAMTFAAVIFVVLVIIAMSAGGVRMPVVDLLLLAVVCLMAAVPFGLLGLFLGMTLRAQPAVAITNVIFLGLSVLGGLWIPIMIFPTVMQQLALALPSFHMGQLALSTIGQTTRFSGMTHLAAATAFSVLFAALALRAYRRAQN